ncbi:(2Fe-2S)-binding protein [Photobacterium sp. Hal280]|uniref:(2Fe-2S)-binding protein n=1 Tax=Photobacterium sp. Hal280 TaxID=3035163 RepID=UPI00301CD6FA
MASITRTQDITPLKDSTFCVSVNDIEVKAVAGESVLSTLLASEFRRLMKNDFGASSGAYCGMGVCHCCLVEINGRHKQRACQTLVQPSMKIRTCRNRVIEGDSKNA